jgi:hypothetical protein
MSVLTLGWQSSIDPIRLPFSIVAHIRVAQRRQFTGGVLGSMSGRRCAINYDIGTPVWDQLCRVRSNPIRRQIDRARQMRVVIGCRRKSLDKNKVILAIDLLFKFISADCVCHHHSLDPESQL